MSPHTKIDTLILSDLHLGSPIGKPKQAYKLLVTYKFKRLILLGDIFDYHANYHKLSTDDLRLLEFIRSLSQQRACEVVWIRGNHDHNRDGGLARFIGSPVHETYMWRHGNKDYLAIHGDQFDAFIDNKSSFNALAHRVFLQLQKMDREGRHLVKLIDYTNAYLRRLSSKIARGAIHQAIKQKADYVFCGHTHIAASRNHRHGDDVIHYYNTGCWTHTPATFAVVDEAGNALLEKFR
ncbi:MAG: metallophosphoesterase family protein [Patescibacteria group bacterium]|nr:metallophosphoesterase family protein [Patescibacteria group bacterium]